MIQNSPGTKLTRVDGRGLWHSWTRNFKTPQLALLDLLDNCFDAAFATDADGHNGKIWIHGDEYEFPIKTSIHHETEKRTTGMIIINSSNKKINPLEKILEVYSSSKGSESDNIGENGVGLKQGCATISDLSIVLTKNKRKMSLGIIAASLQKHEGCYLPSWEFESENLTALELEMIDVFAEGDGDDGVKNCIKSYGWGEFKNGVQRIKARFREMLESPTWEKDDHVFCLIMDKVRHGTAGSKKAGRSLVDEDDSVSSDSIDFTGGIPASEYKARVNNLMTDLRNSLPRQYLHIPDNFDVRVGASKVDFKYWQKRLVELSEIFIHIGTDKQWDEDDIDLRKASKTLLDGFVKIRVFLGFDPMRKGNRKEASMLIYSRQTGRLIKFEADCRSLLGLTAGGTQFCQSLTLIVDDCHGVLPLNPTKQDIAFGERDNGEIFKYNMYSWLSAVTNMYYKYHLLKYNDRKKDLTSAVERQRPKMEEKFSDENFYIKPMDEMKLTRFPDVPWYSYSNKAIRNKKVEREVVGQDTFFRIRKGSAKSVGAPRKRKADTTAAQSAPPKRRSRAKKSYTEPIYDSSSDSSIASIEYEAVPGETEEVKEREPTRTQKKKKQKQKQQKAKEPTKPNNSNNTQAGKYVFAQKEPKISLSTGVKPTEPVQAAASSSTSATSSAPDPKTASSVSKLKKDNELLQLKLVDIQKKNHLLGRDLDWMKDKERRHISMMKNYEEKIRSLEDKVLSLTSESSRMVAPDILDL